MTGDLVVLDRERIERFRRQRALGKTAFYGAMGIHPGTGAKLFRGQPVHLVTARRVAQAMGVEPRTIIASWGADVSTAPPGKQAGTLRIHQGAES